MKPSCFLIIARATCWLLGTGLLILLGITTLLPVFDIKAMIVTSASMAPTIEAGDLALVRQQRSSGIDVGDIITYTGYDNSGFTTHRVKQVVQVDATVHYQTQGDANRTPDPNLVPGPAVYGSVIAHIPQLGRLLAVITTRSLMLMTVFISSSWLAITEIRSLLGAPHERPLPAHPPLRPAIFAAIAVAAIGAGVLHQLNPTIAKLTDHQRVAENTFTTSTW